MSVRKSFTCDLCGASITDTNGIGIIHKANGDIHSVWLHKEGAGRHICVACVKGLRTMLADLDCTTQIHADLDRMEEAARPEPTGGKSLGRTPE